MVFGRKQKLVFNALICLLLPVAGCLALAGCTPAKTVERNGIFSSLSEAVSAYRDYLTLERRGVEVLNLKLGSDRITVTLPFYLFTLGREFERLGNPDDAVKLYLHLQMRYPFSEDESSLGLRIDNRLHWILGDKRWFRPNPTVLIADLSRCLAAKDAQALEALMSRDFGFGEEQVPGERMPVDYRWAAQRIAEQWRGNRTITLHPVYADANLVRLKAAGWDGAHKVWDLVLKRRDRPRGWEWDTVAWGD